MVHFSFGQNRQNTPLMTIKKRSSILSLLMSKFTRSTTEMMRKMRRAIQMIQIRIKIIKAKMVNRKMVAKKTKRVLATTLCTSMGGTSIVTPISSMTTI